jgi:spore germination protein KB
MMDKSAKLRRYDMFALQLLYFGASAGFIYPSFLARSTTGSYWIPLAVWSAGAIVCSWLYAKLLSQLEGKKLLEELKRHVGPALAGLLCLPMLIFLLGALIIMLRAYSEIITMTMLPTTPILFLNGMIIAPALLACAGFMPIIRSAKVLVLVAVSISLMLLLLGLSDVDWTLGIPWARTNGDFVLDKQFYAGSFLWMGFVVTSLIGSYSRQSAKVAWQGYLIALISALPLVAGYIYLPVLTFGRELSRRLTVPFVSKMDSIYHYWVIIENLAAVFVAATLLYILIVIALKLRALGEFIRTFLPRTGNKLVYLVLSLAVFAAATLLPSWRDVELLLFMTAGVRLYVMFVFPVLGIVVLHAAKKRQAAEHMA